MILPLLLLASVPVALLVLLVLVLRDPRKLANSGDDDSGTSDQVGRRHVSYFPQVRRALTSEDLVFLSSRGSRELTNRVRKERRKIGLAYLACLRLDFLKLWRLARVIASLSPQVGVRQELARLRLGLAFSMRYEVIRIKFFFGFAPLPELGFLSDVVSRLSFRLETAMSNLGERAALAAKLASSLDDGHGLNTP